MRYILEVWIKDVPKPVRFSFKDKEEAADLREYISECVSKGEPPDSPFNDGISSAVFRMSDLRLLWLTQEDD